MNQKPEWGVVAIIALIVVITIGFFLCKVYSLFWQTGGSETSASTVQPVTVQPSSERMMQTSAIETPTEKEPKSVDESIVGWKTYQNKKYQFEVRYPAEWSPRSWTVSDDGMNLLDPESYAEEIASGNEELIHTASHITVGVLDKAQADYIISHNEYDKRYKHESIMIGGKTAVRYEINDPDGIKEEVYLYTDRGVVLFSRNIPNTELFDTIVSTVKFY